MCCHHRQLVTSSHWYNLPPRTHWIQFHSSNFIKWNSKARTQTKSQDKTSNVTSSTSWKTLYSENSAWYPSSSLCLLLLQLPCFWSFTLHFFTSALWILHRIKDGSTIKQAVNYLITGTVTGNIFLTSVRAGATVLKEMAMVTTYNASSSSKISSIGG
jgi:hypothetical protein